MNSIGNDESAAEKRLIDRFKAGDRDAFSKLYDAHENQIYGLLLRLTRDEDIACDLMQQTFLKCIQSLDSYRYNARFGTWLYRIATNAWIDHSRKSRREAPVEKEEDPIPRDSALTPEQVIDAQQRLEAVERSVARMSEKLRRVFLLKYVAELSYREIAQVLGCSTGTVGSRLNACMKKLAEDLAPARDESAS